MCVNNCQIEYFFFVFFLNVNKRKLPLFVVYTHTQTQVKKGVIFFILRKTKKITVCQHIHSEEIDEMWWGKKGACVCVFSSNS